MMIMMTRALLLVMMMIRSLVSVKSFLFNQAPLSINDDADGDDDDDDHDHDDHNEDDDK